MSATRDSLEDVADRERRRAADHSLAGVTDHVEEQWPDRALPGFEDADLEDIWDEAHPVHYPSARRGAVARYHRRSETILLARQESLVTIIPLSNRPHNERIYIRNQVIEQ